MNDNDQHIRREAMRLDALEGRGDPDMEGRVAWRASDGDSIWIAAIMPMAGYDHLSMAYDAGDTLIHRLTWHPQHGAWMLRRTYTAHHQPGGDRTREVLDTIATWEQDATPAAYAPASQPLPDDGQGPHPTVGWAAATAQAERLARTLADPHEARAALMQQRLDQARHPASWLVEDYGVGGMGLYLVEWQTQDGAAISYRVTRADWDPDLLTMRDFAHSEILDCHIRPADPTTLDMQARQAIDLMRARLDHAYGAPEDMRHTTMRAGTSMSPAERPLLDLGDGRHATDWTTTVERTALAITMGQAPGQPMPAPQAAAEAMPDSPRAPRPSTTNGRPAMRVPARLVRPYTRHGRDGRDWNKMVVRLPKGTTINGRHWDWWNIDRFMNPRQQQAHARGEAVMVTFKPGEQVELWRGKGPQRRAETIDATALCEAVNHALHPDHGTPADMTPAAAMQTSKPSLRERLSRLETEQPDLCARASDLCMHAIEHDWPRIERLQQRLVEHARAGTWRDDLALKATRRALANTDGDGSWSRVERDTAALMLLEHITRPAMPTRQVQHGCDTPDTPCTDGNTHTGTIRATDESVTAPPSTNGPAPSPTVEETLPSSVPAMPPVKQADGQTEEQAGRRPAPFRTVIERLFTKDDPRRRTRGMPPR